MFIQNKSNAQNQRRGVYKGWYAQRTGVRRAVGCFMAGQTSGAGFVADSRAGREEDQHLTPRQGHGQHSADRATPVSGRQLLFLLTTDASLGCSCSVFFCACAGYAMPCFDRGLYSACCAFMILWARVRRPFVSSGSSSRNQLPCRIEQIGDPRLE